MGLIGTFFFIRNFDEIKSIFAIRISTLVLLSSLVLLTQFLNGFRLKVLTDSLNLRLKPLTWMGMAVIQSFLNYLPFKGGMLANAVYLKQLHNFSYLKFISMIGSSSLITMLSAGCIGFAVSGFYYIYSRIGIVLPCLFLSLIVCAMFCFVLVTRVKVSEKTSKKLYQVIEGWQVIRKKRNTIFLLIVVDITSTFIFSVRYYIAFRAFSIDVPFLYCLLIAPLSILTTFTSITPAGLGIREAVIGYASKILGMGLNPGLFAASLDRAVVMFWVFIIGPVFGHLLMAQEKTASEKI